MSVRPEISYEPTPVYLEAHPELKKRKLEPGDSLKRAQGRTLEQVKLKRIMDRLERREIEHKSLEQENDEILKGSLLFAGSTFLLGIIVGIIIGQWMK